MKNYSVSVKNLYYKYDEHSGLKDINLTIKQGSRVALIGKNGCGKTTLLLHLAGLLHGKGEIQIFDLALTKKNFNVIRLQTGFLFNQPEYQFIMPDVLNDVMLNINSKEKSMKEKLTLNWLESFDLLEYQKCSPLQLSAGEMKRVALAGIFAREPGLVLLDEPLNNLDKQHSLLLLKMLKKFPQTMVIATHRALLVKQLATHLAVMEQGELLDYIPVNSKKCDRYIKQLLF
jgi:cobalt/nickel transport system ATP-binding protein